jgi:hypothetical protein
MTPITKESVLEMLSVKEFNKSWNAKVMDGILKEEKYRNLFLKLMSKL